MSTNKLLRRILDQVDRDARPVIEGEVLTAPALVATDGVSLTYAADLKIPGYSDPIRSVPIALGNRDLIYADVGQAVLVARHEGGRLEIIGFAKRKPGQRHRIAVDVDGILAGARVDVSLSSRYFTYGELDTLAGGYGYTRYGAIGLFRGGVLFEF